MRCFGLNGNMTNTHGQRPIGFAGQVHPLLSSSRDGTRRCNDIQLNDEMTTSMKRLHAGGVVERWFHVL
jgi:hypothetical protein